jgi:hypothetical protein
MSQVVNNGNFVKRTGDTMLGDLCFVPGKRAVNGEPPAKERLIHQAIREMAIEKLKAEGRIPKDYE